MQTNATISSYFLESEHEMLIIIGTNCKNPLFLIPMIYDEIQDKLPWEALILRNKF